MLSDNSALMCERSFDALATARSCEIIQGYVTSLLQLKLGLSPTAQLVCELCGLCFDLSLRVQRHIKQGSEVLIRTARFIYLITTNQSSFAVHRNFIFLSKP
jgi:hypothetical protein